MGACRRAREGESRTGCDCQGGRAGARATGSGVKCRFSAGRPAEWIETGSARIAVLNRGSFSAGRQAEWIETGAQAHNTQGESHVSPLEDQRSGLKLVGAYAYAHARVVSPLEDQRSGLKPATRAARASRHSFLRWKTSGVD